jgi:hypothetical protein
MFLDFLWSANHKSPLRRAKMKSRLCWSLALILAGLETSGLAQKIRVGYDKSADFSKYKTYTWAKPQAPISRPFVYENVVGEVDDDLKAKGLQRIEKDGDLMLVAAGGIGFGYNMPPAFVMNFDYWSGEEDTALLTAPLVGEGTLILALVDRASNKLVWRGTAKENIDPEVAKSLPHIEKAIDKLLKEYPPKHTK